MCGNSLVPRERTRPCACLLLTPRRQFEMDLVFKQGLCDTREIQQMRMESLSSGCISTNFPSAFVVFHVMEMPVNTCFPRSKSCGQASFHPANLNVRWGGHTHARWHCPSTDTTIPTAATATLWLLSHTLHPLCVVVFAAPPSHVVLYYSTALCIVYIVNMPNERKRSPPHV